MARVTIKQTRTNEVTVHVPADSRYGKIRGLYEDTEETFTVPNSGGYVRKNGNQVCEGLDRIGNTLWSTPENLIELIRAEYHKAMARFRREGW